MNMNQENKHKPKISKKTLVIILGVVILVIAFGALLRFTPLGDKIPLPQFAKNILISQSQEEKAKQESQKVINKVSRLMDLPKEEEPVVATVQDKDLLIKEQRFFEGAENGDVLIIYPQAAKAILYSPKRDRLVNVGPLFTNNESQNTQNSQTEQAETVSKEMTAQNNTLKIEIRNGTEKAGLANTIKQTLSGNSLFEVAIIADASKKDYKNTIIIDTGKSQDKTALGQLSQVLGATIVQAMPSEEKTTTAEALVILGKDKTDN